MPQLIENSVSAQSRSSPAATLAVVSVVQFLTPFMLSAVGVALPTIGREFSAGATQLGLIETVYILAVAVFLLPAGRFADIHGRRRVFIAGVMGLIIGTVLLSLAPNVELFILFRFFQGVGASLTTATSLAILTSVFPRHRRGRAMGVVVGCVYLGLSAGPTLAGVMVTYIGWRWIFFAALPVQGAALVLTLTKLQGEWADARGESFDRWGAGMYMVSLLALIAGLTHIEHGLFAAGSAGGGALGLIGFVFFESKRSSPILNIRMILQNRVFTFSNIATWINYSASFGVVFFFSIYLQIVKGLSPRNAGFILVTQPIVQAVFAPIAGRLSDRFAPAGIATIGMGLCAAALFTAATINADSSLRLIVFTLVLLGLGFGVFSTPNTAAIMASVGPREYGVAASMLATMRTTGMLTSMTFITIILAVFMGDQAVTGQTGDTFVSAMQTALILFGGMSLSGIGCSLGRFTPRSNESGCSNETTPSIACGGMTKGH
jgi:EmrB/QacA subfamily drug resistance transporter